MAEITELKGLVTKLLPIKLLENNNGQIEGVPKNPRFIKDWRYKLLLQSLTESPEMLSLKELWVYKVGSIYVVIAGNMRLRGSKEKGYKSLPCKILPPETSVEKLKEYAIKDNSGYGDWEMDSLANEWESPKIVEWGVELNGWGSEMPFVEQLDYSVLDEEDNAAQLERMAGGVKKAIQIEFENEHYEQAYAIVKFWRERGGYVGGMIMEFLKKEKGKL